MGAWGGREWQCVQAVADYPSASSTDRTAGQQDPPHCCLHAPACITLSPLPSLLGGRLRTCCGARQTLTSPNAAVPYARPPPTSPNAPPTHTCATTGARHCTALARTDAPFPRRAAARIRAPCWPRAQTACWSAGRAGGRAAGGQAGTSGCQSGCQVVVAAEVWGVRAHEGNLPGRRGWLATSGKGRWPITDHDAGHGLAGASTRSSRAHRRFPLVAPPSPVPMGGSAQPCTRKRAARPAWPLPPTPMEAYTTHTCACKHACGLTCAPLPHLCHLREDQPTAVKLADAKVDRGGVHEGAAALAVKELDVL